MKPYNKKDSIFSSVKPWDLPWFYLPVLLGVIALVVLFKWFS